MSCWLPVLAQAQPAMATAINRMGRFRALSQRIAKVYCQVYLNVDPLRSGRLLETARKLARTGFDDLAKSSLSADLAGSLAEVRTLYEHLESKLVMPPSRESVSAVATQADKLLVAANAATAALEKLAKISTGNLVNMAGSQRYLSQRLAKNYFLSAAKQEGKALREQVVVDKAEFIKNQVALVGSSMNTTAVRNYLLLGEQQWLFFHAALEREPDARGLRDVAMSSENLLEIMNNLTDQYELLSS